MVKRVSGKQMIIANAVFTGIKTALTAEAVTTSLLGKAARFRRQSLFL